MQAVYSPATPAQESQQPEGCGNEMSQAALSVCATGGQSSAIIIEQPVTHFSTAMQLVHLLLLLLLLSPHFFEMGICRRA